MEISMADWSESYAPQFAKLVRQMVRLRHRFKAVMPDELVQAKARIQALLPEGEFPEAADFDFLYGMSVLLATSSEPMTMGELGQAADVPLSTATRLVDMLVEHGYVERLSDPDDRRVVRVRLTKTGTDLYQTIEQLIQRRIALVLHRFSVDECETLLRLMKKALDGLTEQAG
jgi:DNA-binding MarR family transcriptional regulator